MEREHMLRRSIMTGPSGRRLAVVAHGEDVFKSYKNSFMNNVTS